MWVILWLGKSREAPEEATAGPVDPKGRPVTQREHTERTEALRWDGTSSPRPQLKSVTGAEGVRGGQGPDNSTLLRLGKEGIRSYEGTEGVRWRQGGQAGGFRDGHTL